MCSFLWILSLMGNLFWGVFEPEGLKVRFFQLFKKLAHGIFLIFCMKLQQWKVLKMTYDIYGPKIIFFRFSKKSMRGTFLFWMNLQCYKGFKLAQTILFFWGGEDLVLGFVNKKQSKMSFLSFITNRCIELF